MSARPSSLTVGNSERRWLGFRWAKAWVIALLKDVHAIFEFCHQGFHLAGLGASPNGLPYLLSPYIRAF